MPRGITVRGDILDRTKDGISLDSVWDYLQAANDLLKTNRNLVTRLFASDTTQPGDAVLADSDSLTFEKQSEFGVPQAGRVQPQSTLVGYPLEWYDRDLRWTRTYLRDANQKDVIGQANAVMDAWDRTIFAATMNALLQKTALGSRHVNEFGTQIYSLYDGSSDQKPPSFAGQTFAPGHSHYLVSGAATIDGSDLRDVARKVTEHGYGLAAGEKIVFLVNQQEADVIRGFRAGVDGSPFDFIPSATAPAYLTTEHVAGEAPPSQFNGMPVIGSFGSGLVVEHYLVPAGYVIAISTAGSNAVRNPLKFREHSNPSQRGLILLPGPGGDHPIVESHYEFGFGLGVYLQGAAAVIQIKASGSYDNPVVVP